MKKLSIVTIILSVLILCSCGDIAKKTAKKTTEVALDAIEGVAEAIEERGEKLGEKLADATGNVAQGAGRSLARQLDEHAETVAKVAGKTLVQSLDGLEKGLYSEFYTEMTTKADLPEGVALDFVGLMNDKPVVTAYFVITENAKYACSFEFCSDDCSTVVLTRNAEINYNGEKKYTSVSFAFDGKDLEQIKACKCAKVTVKAI